MKDNDISSSLERVLKIKYQSLPAESIKGSYALLFLEHYRLRALLAQRANFIENWLNTDLARQIDQHFCLEDNIHVNIEPKSVYRYELLYLNWEFYKINISEILNTDILNLPNPYEPMLIFIERGGWLRFFSPFGFNIGNIFIRKPQFEKIVELPPFITFNEAAYKSADEEYSKDKVAFFEKYIRPTS